jgi:hypothetical protein
MRRDMHVRRDQRDPLLGTVYEVRFSPGRLHALICRPVQGYTMLPRSLRKGPLPPSCPAHGTTSYPADLVPHTKGLVKTTHTL